MSRAAWRRRPRGAVLVEFVLVLPLLLFLLLGAVDWGWYFVLRQSAIDATRSGARTGSVQGTEGDAETAATVAVTSYLAQAALPVQAPSVDITDMGVGDGVVRVIEVSLESYPAGSITGFAATFVPETLTARSVMRLEVQP